MAIVEPQPFFKTLTSPESPIAERYMAVFELKNLKTEEAVKLMVDSFPSLGSSELLKHQLVYTLGQLDEKFYPLIKDFLYQRVRDKAEQKLVRHQAAEAIANYFDGEAVPLLQEHLNCGVEYVEQTCQLALRKIKNEQKDLYGLQYAETRQPAAPFTKEEFKAFLKEKGLDEVYKQQSYIGVLNQPLDLVTKYRILYYMRNLNTDKVKLQLCKLLSKEHFKSQSALFKHQVCFVLGQIGIEEGEQESLVRECIQNQEQQDIVRHEALAAVASQSKDEKYLDKFVDHPSQVIRESALVAIGQIKYWHS